MPRGGKREGAGRKSKAHELGLYELINEMFTPDDRREVFRMLVQDAKSPFPRIRAAARELLLAYAFGKPIQRTEHSGEVGSYLVDIGSDDTNHT